MILLAAPLAIELAIGPEHVVGAFVMTLGGLVIVIGLIGLWRQS